MVLNDTAGLPGLFPRMYTESVPGLSSFTSFQIPFGARVCLHKMPGKKEFVRESEAEAFAEELARVVQGHPEEKPAE